MKKMKFVALTLTLLMGISLTSCFNSDGDDSSYDAYTFATVSQSYLGSPILIADDGVTTLYPTNSSALLLSDGVSYPQRVYVTFKYAEGESYQENKTSYNVTIVNASVIYTKNFNTQPDTLANDYSVTSIEAWGANKYINIYFNVNYSSNIDFDMYEKEVGNDDTLYVKFNYSKGGGDSSSSYYTNYISFKLPTDTDVEPKNDSIWVKIFAKGSGSQVIEKNVRLRYPY
ncbi:NigD1/NigD2 family lipoprotein [Bacteroides ihuae]|uniref:NigD1/NigD2 family lipoprotein n=1 Tax=Bacteroides ihuae TaxID=1852362 RepID=UPI0008D8F424|nr:NigD-like C-terminal domain-containing protein [Bacteroides ihuae]